MSECRLKLFISNASFDTVDAVIVPAVHSRTLTVINNNHRQIIRSAKVNSFSDRESWIQLSNLT